MRGPRPLLQNRCGSRRPIACETTAKLYRALPALGQPPLLAHVGLELGTHTSECGRRATGWLRPLGHTGYDERIDEAIEAEPFVGGFVGMHPIECRCAGFDQRSATELAWKEASPQDLPAKDGRRIAVGTQGSARVPLGGETAQVPLLMRRNPIRRRRCPRD